MGQDYQVIEILLFAAVAAFMFFWLRSVLGRRTGHERSRRDVVTQRESLPTPPKAKGEAPATPAEVGPEEDSRPLSPIERVAPSGSALNQTLTEIQIADRNFDVDRFIAGARGAYELIVKAFADGDRDTLKPLLSEEVFTSFSAAIAAREADTDSHHFEFLKIRDARITDASLNGRTAELTVSFEAQILKSVTSANGELVSGDPDTPVTVLDIWTFARDIRSKKPDWLLVNTDTGE